MNARLDDFVKGYIDCALWCESAQHPDDPDSDASFESCGYDESDITPESMANIRETCADFVDSNADNIEAYCTELGDSPEGYSAAECAGHDFWLTRNGHGAGFWDRGLDEIGDRLTSAAKVYGDANLYLGDDDRVHHQ